MPTLIVAVAQREDPAVAGQRVAGAVADVEGATRSTASSCMRALEVAADGHALRVAPVAGRAERPTEARVGAVGDHHVAGLDLAGARRCPCPSRRRR